MPKPGIEPMTLYDTYILPSLGKLSISIVEEGLNQANMVLSIECFLKFVGVDDINNLKKGKILQWNFLMVFKKNCFLWSCEARHLSF